LLSQEAQTYLALFG